MKRRACCTCARPPGSAGAISASTARAWKPCAPASKAASKPELAQLDDHRLVIGRLVLRVHPCFSDSPDQVAGDKNEITAVGLARELLVEDAEGRRVRLARVRRCPGVPPRAREARDEPILVALVEVAR